VCQWVLCHLALQPSLVFLVVRMVLDRLEDQALQSFQASLQDLLVQWVLQDLALRLVLQLQMVQQIHCYPVDLSLQ